MSDGGKGIIVILGIQAFAVFMLAHDPDNISDGWAMFWLFILFAPLFLGFTGLIMGHNAAEQEEKINDKYAQINNDINSKMYESISEFTGNKSKINKNHYESLYKHYK